MSWLFLSTCTVTLLPHGRKPSHFCECHCSSPTRTDICDNIIVSLAYKTHLGNNPYLPGLFASIAVQIFNYSFLSLDDVIYAQTDCLAAIYNTLSLLRLPLIHVGLYQDLWKQYFFTGSSHSCTLRSLPSNHFLVRHRWDVEPFLTGLCLFIYAPTDTWSILKQTISLLHLQLIHVGVYQAL